MTIRPSSYVPVFVTVVAALLATGPASAGGATVTVVQNETYGEYLADGDGMSLYLFEADEDGASTCYEACAQAWPPLTTEGAPRPGAGVDASLLGTVERRDGSLQVTYNDWPLYYFVRDERPGDTSGQDVEGFGAEWYLVGPDGHAVEAEEEEEEEQGGAGYY